MINTFLLIIISFVAAPPSAVEILDHPSNSKIEIKENQEFHLECRVKNAKPAAKIVWYRGKVELNIRKLLFFLVNMSFHC